MKKLLVFLLCMLLLSLQLVSCTPAQPQVQDTSADGKESTSTEDPTEAPTVEESTTATGKTEESTTASSEDVTPEPVFYKLTKNQLKVAKIVYADQAPYEIQNAAKAIQDRVIELYKAKLTIASDASEESAIEIVLGDNTNRNVTFSQIQAHEYGYTIQGQKILISGADNVENTLLAVEKFIENHLTEVPSKVYFFTTDNDAIFEGEAEDYNHSSMMLQGKPIENYRIIYAASNKNKEKELAIKLQQLIREDTGWHLPVCSDAFAYNGGREILIGRTNREASTDMLGEATDIGCVLTEKKFILCVGNNYSGNVVATNKLLSLVQAATESADAVPTIEVADESISIYPDDNPTRVVAMTFNVKIAEMTAARMAAVADTIIRYMPDTVGFQEADPRWLSYLKSQLGGAYEFVGFGRESTLNSDGSLKQNKGEACFVMYKKERFEVVETKTTWLSPTPEVLSKHHPDQPYLRVTTSAVLKDKVTNEKFVSFSIHTNSGDYGHLEVQYAMERIRPYLDAGMPVYLVGDFNNRPDSSAYAYLSGLMNDSRQISNSFGNNGGTAGSAIIDYIWCSKDNVVVDYFTVLDEKIYPNGYDGKYASDHRAVIATLVF
jgi:endonuclease/exonuclease/phosphatase family metal-dependent hydrolase